MNLIFKIIKNIILLPYTILNMVLSMFRKNKSSNQDYKLINVRDSNKKYLISFIFWIIPVYFLIKPFIKYNRIVYACPLSYSRPCSYVEAEYESICDKESGCFRYYSKIIFPNKKVIKFSYCDINGIAVYTCYAEDNQESWRLEYLGKNVLKE